MVTSFPVIHKVCYNTVKNKDVIMKKSLAFFLLSAMALSAEIKITSLSRIENGNFDNVGAEVCGYVTGVSSETQLVKVTADPGSNPGIYWAVAAGEGRKNFCHIIALYGKNVEVSIKETKATRSL